MNRFLKMDVIVLILICLFFMNEDLFASKRRMLGGNFVITCASSYLTINSESVTVQEEASWSYATGLGGFFDYMVNPYVSFRTNWFFYPGFINSNPKRAKDEIGVVKLHEVGFSILRHFNRGYISPWFGAGPYLQVSTINDVDAYVLHLFMSLGFDYEISEDVFFSPEMQFGLGAKMINSNEESVVVDLPTGNDFSSSGVIVLFKLGIGKSF